MKCFLKSSLKVLVSGVLCLHASWALDYTYEQKVAGVFCAPPSPIHFEHARQPHTVRFAEPGDLEAINVICAEKVPQDYPYQHDFFPLFESVGGDLGAQALLVLTQAQRVIGFLDLKTQLYDLKYFTELYTAMADFVDGKDYLRVAGTVGDVDVMSRNLKLFFQKVFEKNDLVTQDLDSFIKSFYAWAQSRSENTQKSESEVSTDRLALLPGEYAALYAYMTAKNIESAPYVYMGYKLSSDCIGQGLGTRFLRETIWLLKTNYPYISGIAAQVYEGNVPSERVLEKVGFQKALGMSDVDDQGSSIKKLNDYFLRLHDAEKNV